MKKLLLILLALIITPQFALAEIANKCSEGAIVPEDIKQNAEKDPSTEACYCSLVDGKIKWYFVDFQIKALKGEREIIGVEQKDGTILFEETNNQRYSMYTIKVERLDKSIGYLRPDNNKTWMAGETHDIPKLSMWESQPLYVISTDPKDPNTRSPTPTRYCVELQQSLGTTKVIQGENGIDLFENILKTIYRYGAGLIGIVCVLVIVVSGVQIMAGGADESMVTSAKTRIIQALVSLVLLFSSGMILRTVNPNFFQSGEVLRVLDIKSEIYDDLFNRGFDIVSDPVGFDGKTLAIPKGQITGAEGIPSDAGDTIYMQFPTAIKGVPVQGIRAQYGKEKTIEFKIFFGKNESQTIVIKEDGNIDVKKSTYIK